MNTQKPGILKRQMYQEAYIFNQPRFLSRRAFYFYPIPLRLSITKQYERTSTSTSRSTATSPMERSTYFPETMDSIVNGIISQSNTYVINFYPTSNFIYTLANSFDPNNEQHTLDLRQGKSFIIVERWQGGPALHRSRGVPSLKWKGAVTCARIRAPERMQYFGEAIFSDDYPGA